MKKYLPLIPLIFWILLYPLIGGLIYWKTNDSKVMFISLISLIAIFNLVWYLVKMKNPDETIDLVSAIGNLIIFNFPAYLMINHYFKEEAKHQTNRRIDKNLLYAEWELEDLKNNRPQKYAKFLAQQGEDKHRDLELTLRDEVFQGFGVYLLINIYKNDPDLIDTFKIITLFKEQIENEQNLGRNILEFRELDLTLFFDQSTIEKLGSDPQTEIYESLVNADVAEIYGLFKEHRVVMETKAKEILQNLLKENLVF